MAEQAGTPEVKPEVTTSEKPAKPTDGSDVTVSEQFKKEALVWKGKAEAYNKLESELAAERAKNEQLHRMAYGGGQAATDPRAELVGRLQELAPVDPVAQATLLNMQETLVTRAEKWLSDQLLENEVPKSKRESVSALIRAASYQMSVQDALSRVTDPETKTLADQLAEARAENDRLKNAKPNGISPASVVPATTSQDDGNTPTTVKMSEYVATLKAGGQRAQDLMKAVGSGKTKLDRE